MSSIVSLRNTAIVAAALVGVVVGCGSSPAASEPPPSTPSNVAEPIKIAASAKTTADLGITLWGVTAEQSGAVTTTGYDAKGEIRAKLTETNGLTAAGGTYELKLSAPHAASLRIVASGADKKKKLDLSNTFSEADRLLVDDLSNDLNGPVLPLQSPSLTKAGTQSVRPQEVSAGVELIHKIGECLFSNRGCLLALGRAGLSLASVGATCSAAGLDGVALVGCTVALVFGWETGAPEACLVEAGEAAPAVMRACAVAFETAQKLVPEALREAGGECNAAELTACFQ